MKGPLIAGDTLDFATAVDAYPPADGWSFEINMKPLPAQEGQPATIKLTSFVDEDGHYRIQVAPVVTAQWVPGHYGWASYVIKSGARHTVDSGQLDILADPAVGTAPTDARTQAQRAVDDLMAARANYAATGGTGVKSYTIGSRSMEYRSVSEIDDDLAFWQRELAREQINDSIAKGRGNPRRFGIQFGSQGFGPSPWGGNW